MDTKKELVEIIFTLVDQFGDPYDRDREYQEREVSFNYFDDDLITGTLSVSKAVSALRKFMVKHNAGVLGRDLWIGKVWVDYGTEKYFLPLDMFSAKITRK